MSVRLSGAELSNTANERLLSALYHALSLLSSYPGKTLVFPQLFFGLNARKTNKRLFRQTEKTPFIEKRSLIVVRVWSAFLRHCNSLCNAGLRPYSLFAPDSSGSFVIAWGFRKSLGGYRIIFAFTKKSARMKRRSGFLAEIFNSFIPQNLLTLRRLRDIIVYVPRAETRAVV